MTFFFVFVCFSFSFSIETETEEEEEEGFDEDVNVWFDMIPIPKRFAAAKEDDEVDDVCTWEVEEEDEEEVDVNVFSLACLPIETNEMSIK